MPFTPFHFGPGLLLKSAARRHVSFVAFVTATVAIDCETLFHLLRHESPIHRWAHSFAGAGVVGLAAGLFVALVGCRVKAPPPSSELRFEMTARPALLGGLVGGLTHPFFDGLMHPDVRPFWPVSTANPFLGRISISGLESACLIAGGAGFMILAALLYRSR